ncbi:MAG: ActS/PrrB/RegB family redox-sensitive histidine kinase [Pseudomonadota bacterium]
MPSRIDRDAIAEAIQSLQGPVRLRTLTTLRWLAVAGQTSAVTIVHFGFGFELPLGLCLAAIAASAWLNLFSGLRYSPQRFLSDREATAHIGFDVVQLCAMLFFTGGLNNPFSVLIIAPVTIAASVLPLRNTVIVGAMAMVGVSLLSLVHFPLPWRGGGEIPLPSIYKAGVWTALTLSVAFFGVYAHRIAAEAGQMKSALAATQLVLSREERLAALGGLAAAAAHELGTPLATIQLTAKEMARDLGADSPLAEDAALLVSQAKRCRDILGRLSERSDEGDAMIDRLSVEAMLQEVAAPFIDTPYGPAVIFEMLHRPGGPDDLVIQRKPELIYGLRNFVENAVGFASARVLLTARWDADRLDVSIHDDGPGFPADVLARLGEPYLSTRPRSGTRRVKSGLGLGFFISKVLLERTGAEISFDNKAWPSDYADAGADRAPATGAWVNVSWPLDAVRTAPYAAVA